MQVVYVLQISDDIDQPVAFATELHAKDRAAIAAHDRGVTLDPWVTGDDGSFMRGRVGQRAIYNLSLSRT